jgi:hypothetical protein
MPMVMLPTGRGQPPVAIARLALDDQQAGAGTMGEVRCAPGVGFGFGLAVALLLASGRVAAGGGDCAIDSDYDLNITPRSVILTRASGVPKALVLRQGKLFVDDRWVALSAADQQRIASFERGARAAMPLAAQLGRDAAEIAFTTLGEVAAGFSRDPAVTRANLAQAQRQLDARLARSITPNRFDGEELGAGIAAIVTELLPSLVGDIVGGTVRATLAGDTAQLQRMQHLDRDIEARIAPQAKALEQQADALCRHMAALAAIDDTLEYRLPDGRRLDLLDAGPAH